jgi:hypothetical protein
MVSAGSDLAARLTGNRRALDLGILLAGMAAFGVGHRFGLGDRLYLLPPQGISMNIKTLIKLEELALAVLSFYLFFTLDYAWWWFPLLFFVPDVSLAGYLFGPKAGAVIYNVVHHKALSILLYLAGSLTQSPALQLAGVMMFGHSSLDRVLGFELQQSISKGE